MVVLRCHKCNRVLARVEAVVPADWKQTVYVPRCSKHDMPRPDRIVGHMIKGDLDGVPLGGDMPLWAIRDELVKAKREGRNVGVSVRFSQQDDGVHLHLK